MNPLLLFFCGLFIGLTIYFFYRQQVRKTTNNLKNRNARLEQEKKIVVDFMHNLAVAIGEGVPKKELYQRIAHTAVITTGAMSACIYEKTKSGRLQGVAVEGLFPPQRAIKQSILKKGESRARFLETVLTSETLEEGEGIVGQVAKTGKPVLVEDATNDPRIFKHKDESLKSKSLVYAPLIHDDKSYGVLVVANPTSGLPFSQIDFSLISSLAEQAALAIKNSDAVNLRLAKSRIDSDLHLASEVQELFLTQQFPKHQGIELDAKYLPSAQVGGDFYDFYRLSSTRFGVCVADVSGKGVPASLLMAICQTNLSHFVKKSATPSQILRNLNQELEERIRQDMFITLFFAIIDTKNKTITYSRAGHEPAIIIRNPIDGKSASVEQLHGNGMAVGMVPSEIFDEMIEDREITFGSGDSLILYTDGVTEATNQDGEEFGIQNLESFATSNCNLSPKSINRKLVSKLDAFSSSQFERDDITLLTIRKT
ncbi:MAG: GAF domain-containing SpoIIE family protein phosphatase [Verrucomicrobiota bacterium]|nr:GAF domain-containing SpoIIE family protein phosphatase [Verrucomicrobiota bacterium]